MKTLTIKWREPEGKQCSAVIAGDFCPREENSGDVARRAEQITAQVKPYFQSADLKILQWECAVTASDTPIAKSGPNLRCRPEALAFAEALGIDTVLLANNHTGDFDAPGIADTLAVFRQKGIGTVGLDADSAEAEKPLILEHNGLAIALLNAAEHEFGIAEKGRPGSNGLDPLRLARRIHEAKAAGQLVIVTLHGGHELYNFPSPRMQELCRFLADAGADAVFNCHTHCPLGYEIYNNVPVVYSPGNFYFPDRSTSQPCWYLGYLPKFSFDAKGAWQLEILPYLNLQQEIRLLDEPEADKFFAYFDTLCAPLADPEKLQSLFDAWCFRSGLNGYLNGIYDRVKPAAWDDDETIRNWMPVRNLFTCESHRDLLRNSLLLIQYQKLDEAQRALPEIDASQNPEWLLKLIGKGSVPHTA